MQKSRDFPFMRSTKQPIFFSAVEGYRQEHGCYPQRILVGKFYQNWETISWCKAQGIQLTGPALGRPAKNAERTKQAKKQEYQDICDRNIVEGEFGVGKRSYGLNRIMARLRETSFCVIGIALLCMNLAKRLRALLHYFLQIWFFLLPALFSHFRGLRSGLYLHRKIRCISTFYRSAQRRRRGCSIPPEWMLNLSGRGAQSGAEYS